MTLPPGADLGPFSSLGEYLQDITEALAATSTPREVLEIVLTPAVQALEAVAGIVLLVDHTDQQMKIAGSQGYEDDTLTLWQEGPIEDHLLISDILRMREALYFEHDGELKAAYPEIESRTGALAAISNAVLPMFLDGQPLGVIVLDFKEPHHFTPEERRFLKILAAQCAVALGRAEASSLLEARVEEQTRLLVDRTRQLEDQTRKSLDDARAQEAFVAFTEAVGSETDLQALVRQAIEVLDQRFPGASVGYYEEQDGLWKARMWSDDVGPELAASIAAGIPAETPMISQVVRTREAVFTDVWTVQESGVELSEEYGAVASYPLIVNGELHWLLSVGLRHTQHWNEADRRLVRAVGRGLTLALERTETARQLTLQNAELQARTRALESFAELTRDLALTTDPLLLIRRAQEVVMSMLADGAALYYELEGDRWFSRSQHGSLHSPGLQAAIDAGLPYAETNNLLIPWTTGQPYFQEHYDRDTDQLTELVNHIGASAALPLRVEGKLIGVLVFGLFHQRDWSSVDRVLLDTVVQSLELGLTRAMQARQLDEERAALEAFTRFTEEVGSETDVQSLVQRAITLLADTCSADTVYLAHEGEMLKATIWNPHFNAALLTRLRAGVLVKQSSLALILQQNTAAFIDHWVDHRDAAEIWIKESVHLQAMAGYPLFEEGELAGIVIIGSRTRSTWDERTKGIIRAVGHSLDLALERAQQAEALRQKNAELAARTQTLEGFSLLTREFSLEHDPVTLIGRTQELILSLLPEGVSTYYELQDDHWHLRSHRGAFHDHALLKALQAGVPRGSILNIERPAATGQPYYQDRFDAGTSLVAQREFEAIRATAGLPILVTDQVQGVLVVGLYQARTWSAPERAVLETVARSLGLVLERSLATRAVLEQRDALDLQAASLAGANEELQAFSYSVSHDLRTPVRHMIGFLGLARKALDGRLDDRSARYLDVVEQAGGRMNTLIDALLDLSRATQQSLRPGRVDLNGLMTQIQTTLLPDLLTRNIRWEIVPLPAVWGDADALKQVLTQLTENAVKFTRTRDPAIIKVWAEDQGDAWGVFVQDNGLGFDPRYQDRLFNLFQRLHSADEAGGTGVGLASVRRLILKHGGQVFAQGQVGEGATFGFTIPKASPSQL
jgi:signal transduction histidine kinase